MIHLSEALFVISFIAYVVIALCIDHKTGERHPLAYIWPFFYIVALPVQKYSSNAFIAMSFAAVIVTVWVSRVSWQKNLKML
jgi:hypothetical protein